MVVRSGRPHRFDRLLETRRQRPKVIITFAEVQLRETMWLLLDGPMSWQLSSRHELLPLIRNYVTLWRMVSILAAATDEAASGDSAVSVRC